MTAKERKKNKIINPRKSLTETQKTHNRKDEISMKGFSGIAWAAGPTITKFIFKIDVICCFNKRRFFILYGIHVYVTNSVRATQSSLGLKEKKIWSKWCTDDNLQCFFIKRTTFWSKSADTITWLWLLRCKAKVFTVSFLT